MRGHYIDFIKKEKQKKKKEVQVQNQGNLGITDNICRCSSGNLFLAEGGG